MKRIMMLGLVFMSVACFAQSLPADENLSVDVFEAQLERGSNVLIDLRTPDEVKKGIIKNATVIDYFRKDFEEAIAKLDPKKTYLLYCASGGRSGETLTLMKEKGFKNVYDLKGGFNAWRAEGKPVQPYTGK